MYGLQLVDRPSYFTDITVICFPNMKKKIFWFGTTIRLMMMMYLPLMTFLANSNHNLL